MRIGRPDDDLGNRVVGIASPPPSPIVPPLPPQFGGIRSGIDGFLAASQILFAAGQGFLLKSTLCGEIHGAPLFLFFAYAIKFSLGNPAALVFDEAVGFHRIIVSQPSSCDLFVAQQAPGPVMVRVGDDDMAGGLAGIRGKVVPLGPEGNIPEGRNIRGIDQGLPLSELLKGIADKFQGFNIFPLDPNDAGTAFDCDLAFFLGNEKSFKASS